MASGVGTVTSCCGSSLFCRPFSALPEPMTKCPAGTDTMSGQVSQSLKLEPARAQSHSVRPEEGARSCRYRQAGHLSGAEHGKNGRLELAVSGEPGLLLEALDRIAEQVLTLSAARVTEI